jgi:hypothetical protein
MTKKTKSMCSGCHENFYNGHNDYGIKECWSFKSARVVKKKLVHKDHVPPWDHAAVTTLSCYRKPDHVSVGPKVTR